MWLKATPSVLTHSSVGIVLGSAAEVEMLLETAQEVGYLSKDTVRVIQQKAARALRVIFGLMRNLGAKWGSRN